MTKNPLQSQPHTTSGYGLIVSPGSNRSNCFDIIGILLRQQLRYRITGRENLRPSVQDLTTLLPGIFPPSAIFELIKQILDRPSAPIG